MIFGFFVIDRTHIAEEVGGSEPEVGTEHVDCHGAADIHNMEIFKNDNRIQRKEERLERSEEHLLWESSFTEDCTHRNEEGTSAEFTFTRAHCSYVDLLLETFDKEASEKALEEDGKLESPCSADEIHSD